MPGFSGYENGILVWGQEFSNDGLPPATFEAGSSLKFDSFVQMITLRDTSVAFEDFLEPSTLQAAAQQLYTAFGRSPCVYYTPICIIARNYLRFN